MKRVIVIGGGLGGLSCAIRLATAGFQVRLIERQRALGGKLQRVEAGPYSFDRGPSTITMTSMFERVFTSAGRRIEDYVSFYKLPVYTRNRFADGHQVDLTRDPAATADQIARYSAKDASRYETFLAEAERLYSISRSRFLNRLLADPLDLADPRLLAGLLSVRPFTTLDRLLARYFEHPNTRMMLGRYATYIGSSPYRTPAVFAMLAHVEAGEGIVGIRGGTYELVRAFGRLAEELGVSIHLGEEVVKIRTSSGKVSGVSTACGDYAADVVVAGGDLLTMTRALLDEEERPSLPDRKIAGYEPSHSGLVLMLGVKRKYEQLSHHTVFFPERYEEEFIDLFERKVPPRDPALYICWNGADGELTAPDSCSALFVLVNAPYLCESAWDWQEKREAYVEQVTEKLERVGLCGIRADMEVRLVYTPEQLREDTGAYRGAIYGISSNSFRQAFFRPGNRSRDIDGLWFVGGTTHPGGGTPVVTACGQLVAERLIREYRG
ncbi:phytoene desaturase family protein [Paenibacillus oceani]|uniref:4,4'-diaponeurosporene oxygenase n=1 Tax=Paenibacillus oceani TaxID=2772510 RepID=A0A927C7X3_9BACL|nr:phytoene desaturase family protein [Paenibacillus oceani]MBD2861381.1 phytoene desaturase [Paenibacillus oceani]